MTKYPSGPIRTLTLDPFNTGIAFIVLEGSECLVDWGFTKRYADHSLTRVGQLIDRYDPAALVLEATAESERHRQYRRLITRLAALGRHRGLTVYLVSRREVQAAFGVSGATKQEIATAISRLFPELKPWLPRERKPWMSEDKRMNIFDAASLGLLALRRAERTAVE